MLTHIDSLSKRYWKHSLWLTAGLTFMTLIVIKLCQFDMLVSPMIVSCAFSLVISFFYSFFWRLVAIKHPDNLTTFYTVGSGLRLLLALITMLVYYLVAGRSKMLPFVAIFMAFYMVMLVYHTLFFSKVAKSI